MSEFPVTIYHNPNCGTSRAVLAAIEAAGHSPQVIDYRKEGWTRAQLEEILRAMGAGPRDILRAKESLAGELGLLDPSTSDDVIIDAMVEHPILVERPIVATPRGTRLCRPADQVNVLLQAEDDPAWRHRM